ncbi:MAG: hypothetical protein ACR2PH_11820, partial [Desulfobulbia bacterium]
YIENITVLQFYRYEMDISSFLVLSDMEVFDLKIRASIVSDACGTCFEFRHCIQINKFSAHLSAIL